jgi:superfamily I DNA/RNA helicase
MRRLIAQGIIPSDICIMVRSQALLISISKTLESNGLQVLTVTNKQPDDKRIPGVRIMTMHRGKGMEFAYVYLPALREDVIPSKRDIEKAEGNEDTINEILLSEANLLSVAITRAKRQVWLSYSGSPSELIERYIAN